MGSRKDHVDTARTAAKGEGLGGWRGIEKHTPELDIVPTPVSERREREEQAAAARSAHARTRRTKASYTLPALPDPRTIVKGYIGRLLDGQPFTALQEGVEEQAEARGFHFRRWPIEHSLAYIYGVNLRGHEGVSGFLFGKLEQLYDQGRLDRERCEDPLSLPDSQENIMWEAKPVGKWDPGPTIGLLIPDTGRIAEGDQRYVCGAFGTKPVGSSERGGAYVRFILGHLLDVPFPAAGHFVEADLAQVGADYNPPELNFGGLMVLPGPRGRIRKVLSQQQP